MESEKLKLVIEEYQCSGCTYGSNFYCYREMANDSNKACKKHSAGTFSSGIGKIFLGMPKGFNRAGTVNEMPISIFQRFSEGWGYNKFNIPAWKYLNENKHTIVRGISPRINMPFLHIFLENCIDQIECQEITKNDIKEMD